MEVDCKTTKVGQGGDGRVEPAEQGLGKAHETEHSPNPPGHDANLGNPFSVLNRTLLIDNLTKDSKEGCWLGLTELLLN